MGYGAQGRKMSSPQEPITIWINTLLSLFGVKSILIWFTPDSLSGSDFFTLDVSCSRTIWFLLVSDVTLVSNKRSPLFGPPLGTKNKSPYSTFLGSNSSITNFVTRISFIPASFLRSFWELIIYYTQRYKCQAHSLWISKFYNPTTKQIKELMNSSLVIRHNLIENWIIRHWLKIINCKLEINYCII